MPGFLNIEDKTRKRRLEIGIAIGILLLVALVSYGEIAYFGIDSWYFLALINLNGLLMVIVLFLLGRNVYKLILERKSKVFGSRLRTQLVLAFLSISFLPVFIMFLASNRVVATSVDYWFTSQVENSMQAAMDVGQSFYANATERLGSYGMDLLADLPAEKPWLSPKAPFLIKEYQEQYHLPLVGFLVEGKPATWSIDPAFEPIWRQIERNLKPLTGIRDALLWTDPSGDYAITLLPADTGMLVLVESIGRGQLMKLTSIRQGFAEYSQIKDQKTPLKLSFTLILALLSLIVIFASIWVAFHLSRNLTDPIKALSRGTVHVGKGDPPLLVEGSGKDELGQLVESFNRMALDVSESQNRLTKLNALLEERREHLEARNEYIETVLEHIATGVFTLDDDGCILTMNKAACTIFGTSPKAWVGKKPAEQLGPPYNTMIVEMLDALHKSPEKTWSREVSFALPNLGGTERQWKLRIHAVNLKPLALPEAEEGHIVAVIDDITDLSRAQRLAAWQEVARRIAHEIKNPLTPIKLSAQRLQRKFSPAIQDPAFLECTHLIIKEVERMQNMVADFSSFAALPPIERQPASLQPVLEEVFTLFKSTPRIHWKLKIDDNLPYVDMDKAALHRAILNVLANAAEALESVPDTPNPTVWLHAFCSHSEGHEKTVCIRIDDNGPGLDPEETQHLFEPYFSKKPGGTGLGLAIVQSIISDHQGTIHAQTRPEGGTRVEIFLPGV